MQKIFVDKEQIQDGLIRIAGDDAHHLRNVLRVKIGETVLVSAEDEWEYACEVAGLEGDDILLRVTDAQKPGRELPSRITLLQCLPKGDKMETIIQKAVELGASEIVPVASKRCVVRVDAKKAVAKVQRWNAIAKAAAEQSRRMVVPSVREVVAFAEMMKGIKSGGGSFFRDISGGEINSSATSPCLLMPYEKETDMSATRQILSDIPPGAPVYILIGPEGGFESEEVEVARAAGFRTISLGGRILRTETAGMATLAMLTYVLDAYGDNT